MWTLNAFDQIQCILNFFMLNLADLIQYVSKSGFHNSGPIIIGKIPLYECIGWLFSPEHCANRFFLNNSQQYFLAYVFLQHYFVIFLFLEGHCPPATALIKHTWTSQSRPSDSLETSRKVCWSRSELKSLEHHDGIIWWLKVFSRKKTCYTC